MNGLLELENTKISITLFCFKAFARCVAPTAPIRLELR